MFIEYSAEGVMVGKFVQLLSMKNKFINYWPKQIIVDAYSGETVEVFSAFHWYALNRTFNNYDSNGHYIGDIILDSEVRNDAIAKKIYDLLGTSYEELREEEYSRINHLGWVFSWPEDGSEDVLLTANELASSVNTLGKWYEYQACLIAAELDCVQEYQDSKDYQVCLLTGTEATCVSSYQESQKYQLCVNAKKGKCISNYTITSVIGYGGLTYEIDGVTGDVIYLTDNEIIDKLKANPEEFAVYSAESVHLLTAVALLDKNEILFNRRFRISDKAVELIDTDSTLLRQLIAEALGGTSAEVSVVEYLNMYRNELYMYNVSIEMEFIPKDNANNQLVLMQECIDKLINYRLPGLPGVLTTDYVKKSILATGVYAGLSRLVVEIQGGLDGNTYGFVSGYAPNDLQGVERIAILYGEYHPRLRVDYMQNTKAKDALELIPLTLRTISETKETSGINSFLEFLLIVIILVVAILSGGAAASGMMGLTAGTTAYAAAALSVAALATALVSYGLAKLDMTRVALVVGNMSSALGLAATAIGIMNVIGRTATAIKTAVETAIQKAAEQAVASTLKEMLLDSIMDYTKNMFSKIGVMDIIKGVGSAAQKWMASDIADRKQDIADLEAQNEELQEQIDALPTPNSFSKALAEVGLSTSPVGMFQPLQEIELDLRYPIEYKIPMSTIVNT